MKEFISLFVGGNLLFASPTLLVNTVGVKDVISPNQHPWITGIPTNAMVIFVSTGIAVSILLLVSAFLSTRKSKPNQ
ncbi:MAG: hypothetical protein AAB883_01430 [Patescibacteria group bacterium]